MALKVADEIAWLPDKPSGALVVSGNAPHVPTVGTPSGSAKDKGAQGDLLFLHGPIAERAMGRSSESSLLGMPSSEMPSTA